MRRLQIQLATIAPLLLAVGACSGGGSDGPAGPGGSSGTGPGRFSATIDGQAWSSDGRARTAVEGSPGTYVLSGTRVNSSSNALSVTMALYNIGQPGTYQLGAGPTVFGGIGLVVQSGGSTNRSWTTPLSGAAGTITISSITASRIAGTFEFTADPSGPGTTGSRTVTSGRFDLPVQRQSGAFTAPPANLGNRASATVGGAPFKAANVIVSYASGTLALGLSNEQRSITIIFANVNGLGTYALATPSAVSATGGTGGQTTLCCWHSVVGAGGTGTLVVTSRTATRMQGTFSFTLPASGGTATGPLTITNGQFDIGLP